jgi:hypothetical protein
MEKQVFLTFSFNTDGTKKGFAIYNVTEFNLQQKFWFHSIKMFFENLKNG